MSLTSAKALFLLAASASVLASRPATAADDVAEQLMRVREIYLSGRPRAAVAALEDAAWTIKKQQGRALGRALPAALPGWTGENVDDSNAEALLRSTGMLAVASAKAYQSGAKVIEVTILADQPLVLLQRLAQEFSGDTGCEVAGVKCVATTPKPGKTLLRFLFSNSIYILISGESGASEQEMKEYAKRIQWHELTNYLRH